MTLRTTTSALLAPLRRGRTFTTGEIGAALGITNRRIGNWLRDGRLIPEAAQTDSARALSFSEALRIAAFFAMVRTGIGTFPASIAARGARFHIAELVRQIELCAESGEDVLAPGGLLERRAPVLLMQIWYTEEGEQGEVFEAFTRGTSIVGAEDIPGLLAEIQSSMPHPFFLVHVLPLLRQLRDGLVHADSDGGGR